MESIKEQMLTIQSMCQKEINLLKNNLDKFIQDSDRCHKLVNELICADSDFHIFGLLVFDRYMTQMLTALNTARKHNIHLGINSLDQTVLSTSDESLRDNNFSQRLFADDFIDWKKMCIENIEREVNNDSSRNKITENLTGMIENKVVGYGKDRISALKLQLIKNENNIKCLNHKSTEMSSDIHEVLNSLLPQKNLDNFKRDFEFEACVAYVLDHKTLEFFIWVKDDYRTLYELNINTNFKPISHQLLTPDEVFCVLVKKDTTSREYIARAVIVPEKRSGKLLQKYMYLLDFGKVIPLTDQCKTFQAPRHYTQIPPLAIKCILIGVEDLFLKCITRDHDQCQRALQKHEFQKTHFRVVHQKSDTLTVLLIEKSKNIENSFTNNTNKGLTNPFLYTSLENDNQIISSNSAALLLTKSGFYDGYSAKESYLNISSYAGNKIEVVVTHVISPISFYGIIHNDCSDNRKAFSWHTEQIFDHQKQMSPPPQLNEIVLAQYVKDGYWYRAKVINIDSQMNLYTIFYVDFGNTEIVSLSGLAKCSKEHLTDPFRAILFHLSNLSLISDGEDVCAAKNEHLNDVIENLVVMILEQTINVEVIARHKDDLVVRLIDLPYANIPNMLIDMGVVKEVDR